MESSDAVAGLERCLDPTLWVVTAAHVGASGGLLATFVNRASIVSEMPRYVVGVAKQHRTWELIEASGALALHVLGLDREHLDWATRFGLESGRRVDKLAGLASHAGASGSPILDGAAGWLDCRVEARFDTGDRTLFLAAVVDARAPIAGQVLTVGPWLRALTEGQRARLRDQMNRDAVADSSAIEAWRVARQGS